MHQIWTNLPTGSRSLQGRQTVNCVDRADGNRGRLKSRSAFLGKVVQQFIQRLVSGIVGCPIGAIAVAGNFDAHGLPAALDLPTKWICAIAAAADDDKISSVSIIGMHTVSNRQR